MNVELILLAVAFSAVNYACIFYHVWAVKKAVEKSLASIREEEAKKLNTPFSVVAAPQPSEFRSGRTLIRKVDVEPVLIENPVIFSKQDRREAIAKKANDSEFIGFIESAYRYRGTPHWLKDWGHRSQERPEFVEKEE